MWSPKHDMYTKIYIVNCGQKLIQIHQSNTVDTCTQFCLNLFILQ